MKAMAAKILLLTSMTVAPASSAPKTVPPTIEAGGAQCIRWDYHREVKPPFDNSYVLYQNSCARAVSFWYCHFQATPIGVNGACHPTKSPHNQIQAGIGWTMKVPASTSLAQIIVIHECPAGYRTMLRQEARFTCTSSG